MVAAEGAGGKKKEMGEGGGRGEDAGGVGVGGGGRGMGGKSLGGE